MREQVCDVPPNMVDVQLTDLISACISQISVSRKLNSGPGTYQEQWYNPRWFGNWQEHFWLGRTAGIRGQGQRWGP